MIYLKFYMLTAMIMLIIFVVTTHTLPAVPAYAASSTSIP